MARRVLLTGSTGYLGAYLLRELRRRERDLGVARDPEATIEIVTVGRHGCDVSVDLASAGALVLDVVAALQPWAVVNVAAVSTIAACERDPAAAHAVNVAAVEVIARSAAALPAPARVVQVSTDLVFDGTAAPYHASAVPAPLSVYGKTKAAAERVVLSGGGGVVVRVPLLFGRSADGRRGATDMIRQAFARGAQVTLYEDEVRTPLHVADAACGLVDVLLLESATGVWHLAGDESVSRYELGRRFADVAGIPVGVVLRGVCDDPLRPRDVSLVSSWRAARSLAESLRDA